MGRHNTFKDGLVLSINALWLLVCRFFSIAITTLAVEICMAKLGSAHGHALSPEPATALIIE